LADDSDAEKTESATSQRLRKARESGDVPRSRELALVANVAAGGIALMMFGPSMNTALAGIVAGALSFDREVAFDPLIVGLRCGAYVAEAAWALVPFAVAVVVAALAAPLLVGGWVFVGSSISPSFGRMNPVSGIGRMMSLNSLFELVKSVAKAVLIGSAAWWAIRGQIDSILGLLSQPLDRGISDLHGILAAVFLLLVIVLAALASVDVVYQIRHYASKMKMTREEVRQENKEMEGNPEIKARIRQVQRAIARRRMMSSIPTADVVVTNPTHYAVALKYSDDERGAPRVVAKGTDAVAAKIRLLAAEHHVPQLEAPALARALHQGTEIGDEIPSELYSAVAQVLAYVFQLRRFESAGGVRPPEPLGLPVPNELDPLDPAYAGRRGKKERK
jgi:flagellar biosynthetic protein FlhB